MMMRRVRETLPRLLAGPGIAAVGWASYETRSDAVQAGRSSQGEAWIKPVPRAVCGQRDRVETGLQGQTTLAERMTGSSEKGYNCNLELVGQFRGEGASWQMAAFDTCAYYGTANGAEQQHKGVVVIDASNPAKPVASMYLDARPMWDPWESLKVNVPRKLLAAVQADRGNGVDPGFAIYDISACARPVLKASINVPAQVKGHAGNFSPDGLTYYGAELGASIYPIDIRNPADPKLVHVWKGDETQGRMGVAHDLTLDEGGTTLYSAAAVSGTGHPSDRLTTLQGLGNGLVITDVSDFKSEKRPEAENRRRTVMERRIDRSVAAANLDQGQPVHPVHRRNGFRRPWWRKECLRPGPAAFRVRPHHRYRRPEKADLGLSAETRGRRSSELQLGRCR